MKSIVADAHVHLYPCYPLKDAFQCAVSNLGKLADAEGDRAFFLSLTERSGSRFFHDLRDDKAQMPEGWMAKPLADENAFCIQKSENAVRLCVLNGRQIVTKERLEILTLTGDPNVSDGQDARHVIETALLCGAVPVLPWAPGKWLFDGGRVVEDLLRRFPPTQLLIGDTTLRPRGFGEPALMRKARELGFKIVAGTDPLPFAGEERMIGQYGITWEGDLGEYSLVRDIRRMLLDPQCAMRTVGRRNGLFDVLRRLVRNHQAKQKACEP
jgi:hypothetical protein